MRPPAISPIPCGEFEREFSSVRGRSFSFRRTARFVVAAIRFSRGLRPHHKRRHRSRISMGNALSEPITDKASACQSNTQIMVGSSCMQGWRNTMEDAHAHILDFVTAANGEEASSYYAVFDGHFNGAVAEYCGENVHLRIKECPAYRAGKVEEALHTCCLAIDKEILDNPRHFRRSGSTGVMVIHRGNKLYCANAGDSRAIMSVSGRAKPLSYDHKPFKPEEEKRIQAAGGFVHMNRVNGTLAVSRGFGDSDLKENSNLPPEQQMVTACPEIIVEEVTDDHEFFLLACDGIWDCKSSQEVVDFVRERVATKMLPDQICEELMMACLAPESRRDGLGCDNMTVVLAVLLGGEPYETAARLCQRPCSPSIHPAAAAEEKTAAEQEAAAVSGNPAANAASSECAGNSATQEPSENGTDAAAMAMSDDTARVAPATDAPAAPQESTADGENGAESPMDTPDESDI